MIPEAPAFGRLVRERRRTLDLTQEELARRVGCAPVTLRKVEHEDLRASVQVAERLAMALAIPLEDRAAFVRQARAVRPEREAPPTPTPAPRPEEIGGEDLSGRAIRGYALGERIGAGGMGAVYRAVQPVVEREVAIKIILPQYADHPEFIRRFEAEAQLVARLEHPYIVPLYDYWREPGVAYLVMRLLRGGSLAAQLKVQRLDFDTVLLWLEQITAALHAAHRAGVIHRDLKPANVLLDEDGNAYLSDFGIAKNLGNPNPDETQADALVGSPNYVSPEQIRSESVRPQADIYSLGVMIYELLAGEVPFVGPTPVEVLHQHLSVALPPISTRRADLPLALDSVLARATDKNPMARYADVMELMQALRDTAAAAPVVIPSQLAATTAPLVQPEPENPYKGLRAFSEADANDFFGRETLTQQLLTRLAESGDLARFLAVVGPSGSGKSSVVKAGLLPALRRGGLPGSEEWFYVDLLPGAHPFEELEAALLRVAVNPPASLLAQLKGDDRGLLRAVRRCLPPDDRLQLLIIIDQFEELFTLVTDEAERSLFLANLVNAVIDERSRVRVLITLRADFTDRPLRYVDFGELIRQRTELILPLTPDELERAMHAPAERAGVQFEEGLAAAIQRDVADQPGALPLLQYVLTELFERRDGRTLTRAAYRALGEVRGALARCAEDVYAALPPEHQGLARQLFLRLVTLGEGVEDTRRRVLRTELEAITPAAGTRLSGVRAVLDAFGKARLLAFDRDLNTRGPTVEVAHEALLREWARLRGWLAESRGDIRLQRQLALAALEWQNANRDPSFLLTGTRLAQFEGWMTNTTLALTPDERAFYEAGIAERQRREAEEEARHSRELDAAKRIAETAQKLAEAEKRRAEDQAASATRLRRRAVYLVMALGAALVLLVATLGLAQLSNQNAQRAGQNLVIAQAANTQAMAEVQNRSTAEAQAVVQKNTAVDAQATAQAEAEVRATAEANAVQARTKADEQAALAFARELDAGAQLQLATDPQLSLLLALQAISVTRAAGLGTPLDVQQTLHTVMPAQRLLWTTDVPYWAVKVAYSSDGKRIMVVDATDNNKTYILDAGTRQKLATVEGYGFAVSPDGKLLATGRWDDTGLVYLSDAITGQQLVTMTGAVGAMCGFAFSPDGNTLAAGCSGAYLWDLRAWRALGAPGGTTLHQPAKTLGCYESNYYGGINFSPDGKRLVAVCAKDKTAKVLDVASGKELLSLTGHTDFLTDANFSPDGKQLATTSADGSARVWDAVTGQELFRLDSGQGYMMYNLAYSPDGQLLATSSEQLAIVWDANTGARLFDLPNPHPTFGIAFSPDGNRLITTMPEMIREWDVTRHGPGELAVMPGQMEYYDFNNSRDGSLFADIGVDGNLGLYNSATVRELWATKIFTGSVVGADGVSFSADNGLLSASVENTVTIWNMESHQPLYTLVQPGNVWEAALSPDGRRLAAGLDNGDIILWDVPAQKPLQTLMRTGRCVYSMEFSPDGTRLAAGGAEGTLPDCADAGRGWVYLWDLAGEAKPISPSLTLSFDSRAIVHINFSPDGQRLAAAGYHDGAIVWGMATGQPVFTLTAHTTSVVDINYSPDGKYLVTASLDKTVKVWDAQTGTELISYPLLGSGGRAFFTAKDQVVVEEYTSTRDTLRLNAFLNFDELLTVARARLRRDWAPGECLKYLHTQTCPGRP